MQRQIDMMSSPDPLNNSLTFQSPPKARRSSRALQSIPSQRNSPKKQTFQLDVGNQLSPQKLRVTVEAEGSDIENRNAVPSSPTRRTANRRRERTTTTTIPVKGLSDSDAETQAISPKKGRGRPRKSAGTLVNRRAGTPTQKRNGRRKSIGTVIDGDDEEDTSFRIGEGVEISRGKGKSRSRSTKGASRKSTPATKQTDMPDRLISSTTRKNNQGQKKRLGPEQGAETGDQEGVQPNWEGESEEELNRFRSPSAYYTIRSTTTLGEDEPEVAMGEDEPDILLARFEPGNETPGRPGWSSPLHLAARQHPNSRPRNDVYPSPTMSPNKSTSEDPDPHYDGCEDEEDQAGEMQEFDTILESEGFSMISMDSVPSLREHLSSPANILDKESKKSGKNGFLAVQQNNTYEDSFSAVPEEVLVAATPARKSQTNLHSGNQSRPNDASSSGSPDVLNGTIPAKKTLVTKLLSRQSSRQSLVNSSFSSVDQEILDAATPAKPLLDNAVSNERLQKDYEDSFSAVSNAVLDAATPVAVPPARPLGDRLKVPSKQQTVSQSVGSSPGRLPTPEETPSPPAEDFTSAQQNQPVQEITSVTQQLGNDSSFVHSQLASSPPPIALSRFTYTAHIRQRRQLHPDAETPSIVFSSPSLPPPIHGARGQTIVAQTTPRPPLSPIARAGQVLQNITVPSSPRSRSQSLGSPFKSPVADRRSASILAQGSNPSPMHERPGSLPRLDLNSQLVTQYFQRRQDDDPFSNNAESNKSPSPEQNQHYTLDLPQSRRYSNPRLENIKATEDCVQSDDAMSWQAEEEISIEAASSTGVNVGTQQQSRKLTAEQRWAAERAAVSKKIAAADPQNVIVIDSDDDRSRHDQNEDDEDFGLLLETLNSSSPVIPKQVEPTSDIKERPRRGKIPSPWRKNKKLVYSDKLSRLSSPVPEKSTFAKNITKEVASQPITVRRIVDPEPSSEVDADLSGWQIPQKSNFQPRVRENTNLDLSALLAASPIKKLPTLSSTSGDLSRPRSNSGKPSLFQTSNSIQMDSNQPSGFTPIPQKTGFNPRPREESSSPIKQNSFLPSIFGAPAGEKSSSSSLTISTTAVVPKPLGNSSPKKSNMPSQRLFQDHSSSSASENRLHSSSLISNDDQENRAVTNSRTQKWAESLKLATAPTMTPMVSSSVSPTKSCLRSPLKTPSANSNEQTPNKGVTFVSSSPIPSSPPEAHQLSATTWSKGHWILLQSIVNSWNPENESSSSSGSDSSGGDKRKSKRNSTRVISRLLGKKVFSPGEEMILEQWHLEAVDEFRGIVPGWQEKVIAMRVFALCVGARQRAEKEAEARAQVQVHDLR